MSGTLNSVTLEKVPPLYFLPSQLPPSLMDSSAWVWAVSTLGVTCCGFDVVVLSRHAPRATTSKMAGTIVLIRVIFPFLNDSRTRIQGPALVYCYLSIGTPFLRHRRP